MKHKNIERLIQKLLDFETNAEEEKVLHAHLSQCKECHRFYQEMVQTQQALCGLTELYPEPGFNDRVLKKLGFRKTFAWSKAAIIFASTWLASFLFLVFSPLPGKLFNEILTSVPALMRFFDKVELVVSSLSHALMPFAKGSINVAQPVIGLIFSILLIYLLGKTLHKEVKCKA